MSVGTFRDLTVYKKAFAFAMDVFTISKKFPSEKKYSLTDQVRSSRSVCSCIGEAYRKRQYKAHFVSKTSDADMENTETRVWLDFALACNYLGNDDWKNFDEKAEESWKTLKSHDRESRKVLTKDEIGRNVLSIDFLPIVNLLIKTF